MALTNWQTAKIELRRLGITVKTSLKGCCLGCQDNGIGEDEKAIYALASRFSNKTGGYVSHQNIGGTLLALEVMAILENNRINWHWDGSQFKAIELDLESRY